MRARWIVALAFAACAGLQGAAQAASADVVVRGAKGEFKEVKERVLHAIENRGLVLNYTARIGAMLERTGKDLGAARRVYGDAELLEFCSAKVSRVWRRSRTFRALPEPSDWRVSLAPNADAATC